MDGQTETTRNTEAAQAVVRGVSRLMRNLGETCLSEFTLKTGRRVDIIALDRKGVFTVVEVKTSVADFRADNKWHEYLEFCDRFYFAVPMNFPTDILPDDCGLMVADGYGSEILRDSQPGSMNAARRKALTLRFARAAAQRLMHTNDPPLGVIPRIDDSNP
ncbi:MAG: MmcB family DNA repair protein [Alphaproteobacteria bacterium]|nr:MmcB family DNA repair protein [Alphaproteobacteria bacterium]